MKSIIISIFAISLIISTAFAQIIIDSVLTVNLNGSVNVPTDKNQKFELTWANVKLSVTPKQFKEVSFCVDYNVLTNSLTAANMQYTKAFSDFTLKATIGRQFGHFWGDNMVDGLKTIEMTRWPSTMNPFTLTFDGLGLQANYGSSLGLKVAGFNGGDKKRISASLQLPYSMLFYTQDEGFGGMAKADFWGKKITLWSGAVKTIDNKYNGFINVKIAPLSWLHLNSQLELEQGSKPTYLAGLTLIYHPNCFLKLYWDSKDKTFQSMITYAL